MEYQSTSAIQRIFGGINKIFISNDRTRVYDPATGTTTQLGYTNSGTAGEILTGGDQYIEYNNKVYFSAGRYSTALYYTLYESTGTTAGTRYVNAGDASTSAGSGRQKFTPFQLNGFLIFRFSSGGTSFWYTSVKPSSGLNFQTYNLGAANSNSGADEITVFNNGIYVRKGEGLYYSDGTSYLTFVSNKPINGFSNQPNNSCIILNGKMWGTRFESNTGTELWTTNGTTAGTKLFKDIYPGLGTTGANSGNPYSAVLVNNLLYFNGTNATYGNELWRSTGNATGTQVFADIYPGPQSGYGSPFIVDNVIFARADSGQSDLAIIQPGPQPPTPILNNNIFSDSSSICGSGNSMFVDGELATGGNGTISYKWFKGTDSLNFTVISNATDPYLSTQITGTTFIFRLATSGTMTDTSNILRIDTLSYIIPGVELTVYGNFCDTSLKTIQATPINAGSSPSYDWYVENQLVPGNHTSTYTSSTWNTGLTRIFCSVKNNDRCGANTFASINIYSHPIDSAAISITSNRSSVCSGSVGKLTLNVTNHPALPCAGCYFYDWKINDSIVATIVDKSWTPLLPLKDNDKISADLHVSNPCSVPMRSTNIIPVHVSPVQLASNSTTTTDTSATGVNQNISDSSCNLIAGISSAVQLGNISTSVKIDSVVHTTNGQPYVQRHYDIQPSVNSTTGDARLKLFFSQTDFDNINSLNGTLPDLPSGPADSIGKANLRIIQYHGTGVVPGEYSGGSITLNPADSNIVWNSSTSSWQVTIDIKGFSGFYAQGKIADNAYCVNNPVTYIAARNGTAFQWQEDKGTGFQNIQNNTYFSGTSTNTLIITPPSTSWNTYKYRCIVTTSNGNVFSDVNSLKFKAIWIGNSDVWEDPGNWSCNNVIPDGNTDIEINGNTAVMPKLRSNRSCKSVTLNDGATLSIQPGNYLTVTGTRQ